MTWQKQSEKQPKKWAHKGVQKGGSKPVGMGRPCLKKRVDTWTKWFITSGGDRAAEKDHRGACLASQGQPGLVSLT